MAVVRLHNANQGCGILVEYQGAASAVVYMTMYVVLGDTKTSIASRTVVADIDGFAHWVWTSAAGYAAGTNLLVEAVGLS